MPSVGESCQGHGQVRSAPRVGTSSAVYQLASVDSDSKPKIASEDSDVLGKLM